MTESTQTPMIDLGMRHKCSTTSPIAAKGQPFDAHSEDYDALMNESLQVTGFDVQEMVLVKLRKLAALFPDWSQHPIRFLDFGCGTGNLYEAFHGFFPIAEYQGVDLSEKMIGKARDRYADALTFFTSDDPEWQQRPYDVIFASGVFHHIPQDQHAEHFQRFLRLLAPGGKVVIWEHNPLNPFTRKIVADCPLDKDAVLIHPARMKRSLRQQKFQNVRIRFTTFFPKSLKALLPLEAKLERFPLGGQYIATASKPLDAPAQPRPAPSV